MKIKLRESTFEEVESYYDYLNDIENEDIDVTESLMKKFPDLSFIIKDDFSTYIQELSEKFPYVDISDIKSKYERNVVYVGQVAGDSLYYTNDSIINKITEELSELNREKENERIKNYETLKLLSKELIDRLDSNNIDYVMKESLSTYSIYVTIYPDDKESIKVRFSDHQESVNRDRQADYSIEVSKLNYEWNISKFKQYPSEDSLEDVYNYLDIN